MLPDISTVTIDDLVNELFTTQQISVSILRLDLIHPVVSGNKLFKLSYFLEEAIQSNHKTMLSFGGAYSNHLVATAYAGQVNGIKTIGVIRGEKPPQLSATLQDCTDYGMELKYITREQYAASADPVFMQMLQSEFGEFVSIPEGGYHPTGTRGASQIMQLIHGHEFTHICTAMGTATTIAGLLMGATPDQQIIGINVLKGISDSKERINYLTGLGRSFQNLQLLENYHFGGYAKKNTELIEFMNQCWLKHRLPLDFVYTAKMLFAIYDKATADYFPKGSKIICIHTGGLQGNRSLPVDTLLY